MDELKEVLSHAKGLRAHLGIPPLEEQKKKGRIVMPDNIESVGTNTTTLGNNLFQDN